jgi:hypothetical protein
LFEYHFKIVGIPAGNAKTVNDNEVGRGPQFGRQRSSLARELEHYAQQYILNAIIACMGAIDETRAASFYS